MPVLADEFFSGLPGASGKETLASPFVTLTVAEGCHEQHLVFCRMDQGSIGGGNGSLIRKERTSSEDNTRRTMSPEGSNSDGA
jgi:hypothetical protein